MYFPREALFNNSRCSKPTKIGAKFIVVALKGRLVVRSFERDQLIDKSNMYDAHQRAEKEV